MTRTERLLQARREVMLAMIGVLQEAVKNGESGVAVSVMSSVWSMHRSHSKFLRSLPVLPSSQDDIELIIQSERTVVKQMQAAVNIVKRMADLPALQSAQ